MAALLLSRLTLTALFGVGVVTLQVFARTNNTFPMMEEFQSRNTLPGGSLTFDPKFTGLKPVDDVFAFVLMFFWPIIDGSAPALSTVSLAFSGQAIAVWTVTMIEGLRSGNAWKAISYTAIFGMASQLLGMGMVAPLYLLAHTFLSPLSSTPTPPTLSPASLSSIAVIPASITISFIIPMAIMTLPSPDLIPQHVKIQAQNTWQVFPITASLTQITLSVIWPYNPTTTPKNTLRYLRLVYKFALTFAVPAHIATTSLSLAAYTFPTLFSSAYVGLLHPANVFVPTLDAFNTATKAASVAQGSLWFIQWDYALVSASFLVWSLALRGQARRFVGDRERMGLEGLLKVGVRSAVLGPAGAALAYVWERDELVFGVAGGMTTKKIQ